MWRKACLLVSDKLSISGILGGCKKDRYVLSKSGTQPHAVKCSGKVYKCDDRYFHFTSLSICSHSIAAAEVNGDLVDFLDWYSKGQSSRPLNLFQASKHPMPAGAGRKGGKPNGKRRKTVTTLQTVSFSDSVRNRKKCAQPEASHACTSSSTPTEHEDQKTSCIGGYRFGNYPEHQQSSCFSGWYPFSNFPDYLSTNISGYSFTSTGYPPLVTLGIHLAALNIHLVVSPIMMDFPSMLPAAQVS